MKSRPFPWESILTNPGWNKAKRCLIDIFKAEISAVDPETVVKKNVKLAGNILSVKDNEYDLNYFKRVVVVGFGKAVAPMAKTLEDILPDKIENGILSVKYGFKLDLKKIKVIEAGHPVPDMNGMVAAQKIVRTLQELTETDLAICLISGGGSALLPLPWEGITLEEKRRVTQLLLRAGATIHEINAIRKHVSQVKGGYLAQAAYPATVFNLILSDVIGDSPDTIASGPTVPDPTTFSQCMDILHKFNLVENQQMPPSILFHFKNRLAEGYDTPKPGDKIFQKTHNIIVGSNEIALKEGAKKALQLGYNPFILSKTLEGESRDVGTILVSIAKEIQCSGNPVKLPACILAGGETTVHVKGNGKGGRNTELALAAALALQKHPGITLLSAGSDGNDGDTDAAGAVVDSETVTRATQQNIDPVADLANNNSYNFFNKLDDLVKTGPTLTNVMDLQIILVENTG